MSTSSGWIGVDLDGTLAYYADGHNIKEIGAPVPAMIERVRAWLKAGIEVRIFTARVGATGKISLIGTADSVDFAEEQRQLIQAWLVKHGLPALPVTATKDFGLIQLYDDRAVSVKMNTGFCLDANAERV